MLKVFKAGESIDGFERGARAFVGGVVGAATGDGPVSLKQQVSSASRATQRRDVTHEEECCSILYLGKMLQKYNGGMRTPQEYNGDARHAPSIDCCWGKVSKDLLGLLLLDLAGGPAQSRMLLVVTRYQKRSGTRRRPH
jgi:hypothetical protein